MKARRFLNLMIVSLVAMTYTSCSNSDDVIDTPDPIVKTYTMSIEAQKGSNGTRALDLDGNTLNSTWTAGETVKVYKDNAELGTLTAQGDGASTSLKGTLTGDLSVNDKLTLKYLSPNYNSQKGTIASISKNCDYSTATVTVSGIAGGNISTTNANFENHQAVIKFTLKDADGKEFPSNPTSFRMTDGTSTVTLTDIPDETYTTNGSGVLYVAFPASDASATITLSATAGDAVYGFGKTGITFEKGKYYGVTVKMKEIPVLNGKFTINASGDKVYFSKGNLQATYNTSWSWAFATNQWDYIGNAAGNTSINGGGTISGTGTVDLFGWVGAACAWTGAAQYGISNVKQAAQYGYVEGEALKSDWGTLAITNGGNTANFGWHSLASGEWEYLFKTRTTPSGVRYAHATVNSVPGLVLLPDDWSTDYYSLNKVNDANGTAYTDNVISSSDWTSKLEAHGAVFLPAGGYRNGAEVSDAGVQGNYWSSTSSTTVSAIGFRFSSAKFGGGTQGFTRNRGCSVRLVYDAN